VNLHTERLTETEDRIADGSGGIPESSATRGAKVSLVRMHAEPIAVEMSLATMRTENLLHPQAKDRTYHVVDRINCDDLETAGRQA